MKTKDGKIIRLDANERRVGNFIYRMGENHVKVLDIGSMMTHRVCRRLNVGRLLESALDGKNDGFLAGYATMMWQMSCVMPDIEFMKDINAACAACVDRHKDFYGVKENVTKEEDDKILNEEREMHDVVEKLRGKEEPRHE